MVTFELWTEEPTLQSYQQNYSPREDYCLAGLWPFIIVNGASGKRYHGMRGFGEIAKSLAHTYCFVVLNENDLTGFSPDLFPEQLPFDQMEEYEYSESADGVHFVGENVRLDVRPGSLDWSDAKGRFEIHADFLGQAYTFWVPKQEGIMVPIQHRSQLGKVTGQINEDPVEGLIGFDASFSHPGVLYFQLPLIQKLEKLWAIWLVEYKDGDFECGCAWKGRSDPGFSPGQLIRNGVSTAVRDARLIPAYHERGAVKKARVELADEWFELEQDTCSTWPFHTFGHVVSTSRGKEIAKSWNYTEWVPDNIEELLELYVTRPDLFTNSREIYPKSRVENERFVIPEGIL